MRSGEEKKIVLDMKANPGMGSGERCSRIQGQGADQSLTQSVGAPILRVKIFETPHSSDVQRTPVEIKSWIFYCSDSRTSTCMDILS